MPRERTKIDILEKLREYASKSSHDDFFLFLFQSFSYRFLHDYSSTICLRNCYKIHPRIILEPDFFKEISPTFRPRITITFLEISMNFSKLDFMFHSYILQHFFYTNVFRECIRCFSRYFFRKSSRYYLKIRLLIISVNI